jgi:hypothetical protein
MRKNKDRSIKGSNILLIRIVWFSTLLLEHSALLKVMHVMWNWGNPNSGIADVVA